MPRPDDTRTPTPPAPEADGQLLPVGGGYRLLTKLGQGAFGVVWRAAAPGGVMVAVKVISRSLKPEEARRELEALEVIKQLRHHNLLSLQAFFPLDDRLIIVLELADGSLRGRLRACPDGQGLPVAELLRYTAEAAEALDYLHEQKVQHRDIKPDNLLLLGNHLKVADCGLARVLETVLLQNASHAGTPAYMPPEIWGNKLSPHSDQYSLAVTYGELRLGRFPIPYDNLANLMFAHLKGQPELEPLPAAEQAVLLRALAKEPGERYPSCTAFARALVQAVPTAGPDSRGGDTSPPVPPASDRPVPVEAPTQAPSSQRTEARPQPAPRPNASGPTPTATARERGSKQRPAAGGWKNRALVQALLVSCVLIVLGVGLLVGLANRQRDANPTGAKGSETTGKELREVPQARGGRAAAGEEKRKAKPPDPEVLKEANVKSVPAGPPAGQPDEAPKKAQEAVRPRPEPAGDFAKSIGMELVPIAAGEFDMGADKAKDSDASGAETPRHKVKIQRPFFLAAHKTTQAQFEKVMDWKPSYFSATGGGKDKVAGEDTSRFPVELVNWFEAVEFCNKLSAAEGRQPCYRLSGVKRYSDGSIEAAEVEVLGTGTGYRLPTEAEWEYCARAGTSTKYSFGEDAAGLGEHAWFDGNSGGRTHPVGKMKPNRWDLYDMGGLVWEWCEDVWHDSYNGAPADGSAWLSGDSSRRVVRGGSWSLEARRCRPANRNYRTPGHPNDFLGFRVVRVFR